MFRNKNRKIRENEDAVSPVVGVMLMLVVTIIIAAVVSGFAGGMIGGNNQKTPTLAMDVKIVNTGSAVGSGFSASVLSISDPTPTKNLKMMTSWVTTMKDNSTYPSGSTQRSTLNGTALPGGSTVDSTKTMPYGFGPGISGDGAMVAPYNPNQYFGNFTLAQGTGLIAEPATAYSQYGYAAGGAIQTLLGSGWEQLRAGDVVSIRIIYTPTGKTLFAKDVIVSGA